MPGRGPELQDCLARRALDVAPTALVVHRLDRDTSGLLLMALDLAAQRDLSRQFAERSIEKLYTAVVAGTPTEDQGLVDLPLRKDFARPPRHCVDLAQGRPAQTRWRVVARQGDRCRLAIEPLTGRSHQIRLHLATIGHPILGDNLYAGEAIRALAPRLLLHAERLGVAHPDDGRRIAWSVATPF